MPQTYMVNEDKELANHIFGLNMFLIPGNIAFFKISPYLNFICLGTKNTICFVKCRTKIE